MVGLQLTASTTKNAQRHEQNHAQKHGQEIQKYKQSTHTISTRKNAQTRLYFVVLSPKSDAKKCWENNTENTFVCSFTFSPDHAGDFHQI